MCIFFELIVLRASRMSMYLLYLLTVSEINYTERDQKQQKSYIWISYFSFGYNIPIQSQPVFALVP